MRSESTPFRRVESDGSSPNETTPTLIRGEGRFSEGKFALNICSPGGDDSETGERGEFRYNPRIM